MPYTPVPPGPDLTVLQGIDPLLHTVAVLQGSGVTPPVFGLYRSQRVAQKKANGKQAVNPPSPRIYLQQAGVWYVVPLKKRR